MTEIDITKSAQDYLSELLEKQDKDVIGIKIFVIEPGTPKAETCIAYFQKDDVLQEYFLTEEYAFNLYLETNSLPFIEDAKIDFASDKLGGTLTIKAPNAKLPLFNENGSLEDKVNYMLYSEINPGLSAHGGEVSLVELLNKDTAVLQFGGGCQGCGMVDLTLKDGVEKTLLENIPELKKIVDVTDHSYKENAYYK
ncbi:uncharacterized protein METZ01_LOCUS229026 [marine metagenome]|uniref:NIF system FeS cluster assembly NifU C-terminal domain-containing protein n=1 Tax=marine metagenome TaxID=408172 RepID=A0A382GMP5_9ZZZZ